MRTPPHSHWGKVKHKLKGLYCPSLRCSTTVLFSLKTTILDWKSLRQLFSICNFSVISLCPHKKCASLLKNQIPCAKSISWVPPPFTYWNSGKLWIHAYYVQHFVGCRIGLGMHEKHKLTLILSMIVVFLNKDILIAIEHLPCWKPNIERYNTIRFRMWTIISQPVTGWWRVSNETSPCFKTAITIFFMFKSPL